MAIWKSRENSQYELLTENSLRVPLFIQKWLTTRGYKHYDEIQKFINPSLRDLTDPLKLHHMDLAVNRLKTAWQNQENICVYGDYDLDGSSGIALLVKGFELLGYENVSYYQPSRFEEGYGINKNALKIIKERGDSLCVSVDCGITAVEEAMYAKELNLDLIITDHHLPQEQLPQAVAVINPNKGNCLSNLGHLSGVGVAFYLIMALKRELNVSSDIKSLLDFFTIGTITDMVPLIYENRVLLKHGLKILSHTQRAGLKALIEHLGLNNKELDTQDVSFSIGPKLNALSRLEKGIRPLDLFLCEDSKTASLLVEQVLDLNNQRKKYQEQLNDKINEQLNHEEYLNPAIVLAAEGHAGVVGLVATKVAQATLKPTFIVAFHNGEAIGSARGNASDELPTALNYATNYLLKHGGHAQAAGFSLEIEKFNLFKQKILEFYSQKSMTQAEEVIEYDFETQVSDFSDIHVTWLSHLGPFGNNNPQPLFKLKNFSVKQVQWLKKMHLKIYFSQGKGQLEGMYFFAQEKIKNLDQHLMPGLHENTELLVEPSFNYFNGQKRVQLIIRDIRINIET